MAGAGQSASAARNDGAGTAGVFEFRVFVAQARAGGRQLRNRERDRRAERGRARHADRARLDVFRLAAAFEAELWELEAEAQGELLKEAGLERPARERLIAALYRHLGLVTFYTVGEPEAHSWPLRRGASALEAAAEIHSDIARGFIRCEVMGYEDFVGVRLGSEGQRGRQVPARRQGLRDAGRRHHPRPLQGVKQASFSCAGLTRKRFRR